MAKRATVQDLSAASGLSISTVNRVLHGRAGVRSATAQRVLVAAKEIGFYGLPALRGRLGLDRPGRRFGVLLLQSDRAFYRLVADALTEAASADPGVELEIGHMDDLSADAVAAAMLDMGERVKALAVVSAEHPRVTEAVDRLAARGVRTVALISSLTAPSGATYVGLDSWKVGRTAAWAIARHCKAPGRVGILVGSHRYRCQEMNEAGFRSYFREHAPDFTLLEPLQTFEDRRVAREVTELLLDREPHLAGLYISGGGGTGALAALKAAARPNMITVSYERMEPNMRGLTDGTLSIVIAHPLDRLAVSCLAALEDCVRDFHRRPPDRLIPFEIVTPENI